MSAAREREFDEEVARLQGLLATLDGVADPTAAAAARELVQVVTRLHALGLADLLGIVDEAGSQPADTLLPKFLANPRVRGLLLLHDMHPDDLETRARQAIARLRPHLGVHGLRAEVVSVDDGLVRVALSVAGERPRPLAAEELKQDIDNIVFEMAPDAADVVIDGLDTVTAPPEVRVPIAAIRRERPGAANSGR